MDENDLIQRLTASGIRPSAHRVAVARYVLRTADHPTADQVFQAVRRGFPLISRATVYNTLNLFVEKGLLGELTVAPGAVVYDPNTAQHHHFIDDASGAIEDIPWHALHVEGSAALDEFDVRECSVVLRGRRTKR